MARKKQQCKNGKTRPQGPYQRHTKLVGPHVIESIDRNLQRIETLVDEARGADQSRLNQIKTQLSGINYALQAQRWILAKSIPDAKPEVGEPEVGESTLLERMWARVYDMELGEFLRRVKEDTLPPRPPLPVEEGYEAYEAAKRRGDETEVRKHVKLEAEHRLLPEEQRREQKQAHRGND